MCKKRKALLLCIIFERKICELGVKYILLHTHFHTSLLRMHEKCRLQNIKENKQIIYETAKSFDTQDTDKK